MRLSWICVDHVILQIHHARLQILLSSYQELSAANGVVCSEPHDDGQMGFLVTCQVFFLVAALFKKSFHWRVNRRLTGSNLRLRRDSLK